MNYKEEIIKIVNNMTQENLLQFFYSMLRVATSDVERYEKAAKESNSLFSGQ